MSNYKDEIRARESRVRRSAESVTSDIASVLSTAHHATDEAEEAPVAAITSRAMDLPSTPTPLPLAQEASAPAMERRGVQFRPADLDLIADMVHSCRKGRLRLTGKLGPSIILRAALDQLADIYENDRPRFLSIMAAYANRRIGESAYSPSSTSR